MKLDKRSQRTRAWLLETLLELIEEKDYSQISITELTGKADIARQTFYRNYDSMDDILLSRMKEILDDYLEKAQGDLKARSDPYWDSEVKLLIEVWQENMALFKALQKAGLAFQALGKLSDFFTQLHMQAQGLHELDDRHQYLVYYLAGGVYTVLYKWVENDMDFPVELLTDLFKRAARNVDQIGIEYING
jgi:AcrR family transcriptional regulator